MKYLLCTVFSLVVVVSCYAQCSPTKVLKIVTQNKSEGIDPESQAARPITLYRYGSKYGRIEEQPDDAHKIHGLIITAEPNSWMVNLMDHTGTHIVDPDPKGVVQAPIFPSEQYDASFPKDLSKLEYGCEREYFDSRNCKYGEMKNSPEVTFYKQTLGANGWSAMLIRLSKGGVPYMIMLFHGDKLVTVIGYVSYEEMQEVDMKLFEKPEGVTFKEGKSA